MKKQIVADSVETVCEKILAFVTEKGFTVFADIDHQANAAGVGLEMPSARTMVFGNPQAGTRLMQQDIGASYNLPLRIAVAESNGETLVMYPDSTDFEQAHDLRGHPVLLAVDQMFTALLSQLDTNLATNLATK